MIDLDRFPYWTISEMVAENVVLEKRRKQVRREWRILGVVALCMVSVWGPILWARYQVRQTDTAALHIGAHYGDDHPSELTSPKAVKALADAVAAWRKALPERKIETPRLLTAGSCHETGVIACANTVEYAIEVVRVSEVWDLRTVMLHEMGHLLGVPHIEGDDLMDAQYAGKVDGPTRAAIALAKLGPRIKWVLVPE